jgi:hypothetical protein
MPNASLRHHAVRGPAPFEAHVIILVQAMVPTTTEARFPMPVWMEH